MLCLDAAERSLQHCITTDILTFSHIYWYRTISLENEKRHIHLHDVEHNVHCADLGVKRIPGHVVLAQELRVVRLRQLQVVLASLEHVDVLRGRLVRPLVLEILSRNDAEDRSLVCNRLLLPLCVVEDNLGGPDGVGLVLRENVEVGVSLEVLVNQTWVDPGSVLVERDVERLSNLINLENRVFTEGICLLIL